MTSMNGTAAQSPPKFGRQLGFASQVAVGQTSPTVLRLGPE